MQNSSTLPIKRFIEEGAPQFYDVTCIKRVVGFFDMEWEKFIIDKRNNAFNDGVEV